MIMNRTIKNILIALLVILSIVAVCAATILDKKESSTKDNTNKDRTYDEGFDDGYIAGKEAAMDYIADALQEVESDAKDKYGLIPEEAIYTLQDYFDGGLVTQEEAKAAFLSISEYYSESYTIDEIIEWYMQ